VNFSISSCSQAVDGYGYVFRVSGVNGGTPKSAKCQQNSNIEMCIYTNLIKLPARVTLKRIEDVHSFENDARLSLSGVIQ